MECIENREQVAGAVLIHLQEALRQLRKTYGVTTTAVITMALGIGATTLSLPSCTR